MSVKCQHSACKYCQVLACTCTTIHTLICSQQYMLFNYHVPILSMQQEQLEEQFILYQHLPEMKRLLDFDNILLYIRAGNCLSENDIHKIEVAAEKVNVDKAVHELTKLVRKRGKTCLERFFTALRRSAHEENHPGHKELLAILKRAMETTQGAREIVEEISASSPDATVSETVQIYEAEGAVVYTKSDSASCEQTEDVFGTEETAKLLQSGDGSEELKQEPVSPNNRNKEP